MAVVLAVASELMLGSRVEATLTAAGHEVRPVASVAAASNLDGVEVVVADLDAEKPEALVSLGVPVLGYYQHTDPATREAAEAAGVDRVVPRSKLVREMPELVQALLS